MRLRGLLAMASWYRTLVASRSELLQHTTMTNIWKSRNSMSENPPDTPTPTLQDKDYKGRSHCHRGGQRMPAAGLAATATLGQFDAGGGQQGAKGEKKLFSCN